MFTKSFYFIVIMGVIFFNTLFLNIPISYHILCSIVCFFIYYWHKKLVNFCQVKMKDFENNNEVQTKIKRNYLYKEPIIWSDRLRYKNSPFLEACKKGDTFIVKSLIQNGVNIFETNIFGESAIFLAACDLLKHTDKKDASCIWTLHKAGCSVNVKNKDGFTALHFAAFKGHCALISWLLKKGADVTIDPSPAGLALVRGHKKAAAIILAHQYKVPLNPVS